MSDAPAEAEIVRGLRQGDRRAWEALCEQYSRRVWRYVARLIGSDENAVADVFQETLLAVAKSGRAISQDTRLWPWLAAIGHNQAAYYWRKVYGGRRFERQAAIAARAPEQGPLEQLLQAEKVELVRCLLAEMNADYAAILTGKYLDGQSVAELVELMGGTQESIRSKLARARRDFRSRYEEATQTEPAQKSPSQIEALPQEGD